MKTFPPPTWSDGNFARRRCLTRVTLCEDAVVALDADLDVAFSNASKAWVTAGSLAAPEILKTWVWCVLSL